VTTIATDGHWMAGDGQAEAGGTVLATSRCKVVRLSDGSLFGSAGRSIDGAAVAKWLVERGKPPKVEVGWCALRVYPGGRVEYLTQDLEPVSIDLPAAIGSGMDLALGAMLAGATPKEAIEIAAQRDMRTGGAITVLSIR
jgi:ATP-dependent protease HslVU (ClpYQ) peptidase subunit